MIATAVLVPAGRALRRHVGSAVVLATAAALGLAAVLPAVSTARLRFATVPDGEWAPTPGPLASPAAAIQQRGADTLAGLARGLGLATLAVAAITVAVVSVARATTRRSDVTVRRAMGASRRVLVGAYLVEGGAIAVVGVGAGLTVGAAAARGLVAIWPGGLGPDGTNGAVPLLALATGVMVVLGGLLPLIHARRRTVAAATGGEELWLPLPAAQFGLGLTALLIAGQLSRRAVDWTSRTPAAVTDLWVVPVATGDGAPAARAAAWDALLERVAREEPGASLASPGTVLGMGRVDVAVTDCGHCAQGGLFLPHHAVPVVHHLVSPDTFRALRLPVLVGRGVTRADVWPAGPIAVVSANLARRHFESGNAVGRLIRIGRGTPGWHTVVGVVDDRDATGFGGAGQPPFAVYLSIAQHPPRTAELLLEGGSRPPAVAGASPAPPATLPQLSAVEAAPGRWFAGLIRLEGWAAVLAAALGMFAVMRLWMRARVPELALRRALGAGRARVLGFVAARAAGVIGGGIVIAWWLTPIVAAAAARVIPGVPVWDAGAAVAPVVVLAVATVAGVLAPAWRVATAPPGDLLGHAGP